MTDDTKDEAKQDEPLDLTPAEPVKAEEQAKAEAPEPTEAEIAEQIADEARAAADEAEEAVVEAEAEAAAVTIEEAAETLAAIDKELERAVKSRDKIVAKIKDLSAQHVEAGKVLDALNPPLTHSQQIQSVLKSQRERRASGTGKPNPIDVVGTLGPNPFQQ